MSSQVVAAMALSEKIKAGLLQDGFKARGVTQKCWSKLTTTEMVNDALRELEEANWVRKIATDRKGAIGRPQSASYEINPAIFAVSGAEVVPTKPTKRSRKE
jgi:hypothetical protein